MLERAATSEQRGNAKVRVLPVASTRLPAHPASSRAARAFVADQLRTWDLEPAVDDSALLVSEVVTDAVLHVRLPIELVVRKVRSAVRVEVFEQGRRSPKPLYPDIETTAGRGLSLVQAVAGRWGIDDIDDGRTVWFEIAL